MFNHLSIADFARFEKRLGKIRAKSPYPAPITENPSHTKRSRPADMCGWTGHNQGNLALRVCEAARPSARFSTKFCPQGNIRGKEFLSRDCAQKWVPPKAQHRSRGPRKRAPAPVFRIGKRMAVKSGEQKGVPAGRKNPSRNAFVPCICSPLSLDALAGVSPAPSRGEPSVRVSTPVNGAVRQSCK